MLARTTRSSGLAAGVLIAFVSTGCMSSYYGQYERQEVATADTLQTPPMTIDDVIALAKDSLSDDVIISQIKATNAYFQLTTNDIIRLKKAGVSEKVIDAMIKTTEPPKYGRRLRRYSYYPGYYPYTGYYYGYPWYSSYYLGLSFGHPHHYYTPYIGHYGYYGGHYGGHGYSGGHGFGGHGYSGGHGSGGHRSFGSHR